MKFRNNHTIPPIDGVPTATLYKYAYSDDSFPLSHYTNEILDSLDGSKSIEAYRSKEWRPGREKSENVWHHCFLHNFKDILVDNPQASTFLTKSANGTTTMEEDITITYSHGRRFRKQRKRKTTTTHRIIVRCRLIDPVSGDEYVEEYELPPAVDISSFTSQEDMKMMEDCLDPETKTEASVKQDEQGNVSNSSVTTTTRTQKRKLLVRMNDDNKEEDGKLQHFDTTQGQLIQIQSENSSVPMIKPKLGSRLVVSSITHSSPSKNSSDFVMRDKESSYGIRPSRRYNDVDRKSVNVQTIIDVAVVRHQGMMKKMKDEIELKCQSQIENISRHIVRRPVTVTSKCTKVGNDILVTDEGWKENNNANIVNVPIRDVVEVKLPEVSRKVVRKRKIHRNIVFDEDDFEGTLSLVEEDEGLLTFDIIEEQESIPEMTCIIENDENEAGKDEDEKDGKEYVVVTRQVHRYNEYDENKSTFPLAIQEDTISSDTDEDQESLPYEHIAINVPIRNVSKHEAQLGKTEEIISKRRVHRNKTFDELATDENVRENRRGGMANGPIHDAFQGQKLVLSESVNESVDQRVVTVPIRDIEHNNSTIPLQLLAYY